MQKNIRELFITNLDNIPDESFTEGNSEINSSGDIIRNFRKALSFLENDLFDTIEIIQFDGICKNVFFRNYELEFVVITDVQKLVDELFLIYGADDKNRGRLNSEDIGYFYSDDYYTLFNRNWSDQNKIKNPIDLSIDREAQTISLGIWGIGL